MTSLDDIYCYVISRPQPKGTAEAVTGTFRRHVLSLDGIKINLMNLLIMYSMQSIQPPKGF